jgi:hypothetical protein
MTDDDELAEARATGRAKGEAAPPLSPALRDYVNTVLAEPMRDVRRRHEGRSDAEIPRSSTGDRRSRRRA